MSYTPVNRGSGENNYPTRSSRKNHASYLQRQLDKAWNNAKKNNDSVVLSKLKEGVYLQIEGKAGYDLVTKSLEDARQHVRLLNISDSENIIKATVYVPNEKKNFFVKKINKYANSESGLDVVTTIEKINLAMVESLWIGKKESIPNKIKIWCEIWLRYESKEKIDTVIESFFDICNSMQIEYKRKKIVFPERAIVLIKANINDLRNLMLASSNLAEIRKEISLIDFYTEMTTGEQKEWVEDLEKRVDVSKRSNTTICLLDTGVNNAHPLIKKVLKDSDMHTIDVARGVDDRKGHGTEMAGIATYFDLQEKLDSMSTIEVYHYLESVNGPMSIFSTS